MGIKPKMDSLSVESHEIVIVGGGICGLATALALHRFAPFFFSSTVAIACMNLTNIVAI